MGALTVVVAVDLPLVPMLAILFYSLYWIMEWSFWLLGFPKARDLFGNIESKVSPG